MTEHNCETCMNTPFVCLANRRGFVLKEDVECLEIYTKEHNRCPFDNWRNK
jgi:hypothetical protein